MNTSDTLAAFIGHYQATARDLLSENYVAQLRNAVTLLERYNQGPVLLGDLCDEMANGFTDWLQRSGRSPDTVRGRRNAILCLWREAFQQSILTAPPLRIRRIRSRRRLPEAWSIDDVRKLMEAASQLPRRYKTNIQRSLWWRSLIAAGWDTALRLGDLLSLQISQVRFAQPFRVRQHKTGDDVLVSFNDTTAKLVDEVISDGWKRDLVWPWP